MVGTSPLCGASDWAATAWAVTDEPAANSTAHSHTNAGILTVALGIQLSGPRQKVQEAPLLIPQEARELAKPNALRLGARVRLDAPLQVFASPGTQPVASRGVPQKSQRCQHLSQLFQCSHNRPSLRFDPHAAH